MSDIYNSQLDAFDLYHLYAEEERARHTSLLGGPALPALGHALAGAAGSAISNTAVYPLDLIITRLQIQRHLGKQDADRYRSIPDAARKIYADEGGLHALYAGVREDTAKSIADAFLFFLAYNFLRQLRISRLDGKSQHLPVLEELSVGFAAGALSKLLTTPIGNIVTRMQTSSMTTREKATASNIAAQIRREKGIQGFWSGYSASLVLTLNPSLTFFFFETLKRFTLPRAQREHPAPSITFLLAAVSKAMASTITYPFSLAKARAQSSAKSVDHAQTSKTSKSEQTPSSETRPKRSPQAVRRTVFGTIAAIARNEGLGALYVGLSGEVLKGFFSHGITMLVKESVHRLIIRLYYVVLKLLKQYPESEVRAKVANAKAKTVDTVGTAKIGMEQTIAATKSHASDAVDAVKLQASSVADTVKSQVSSAAGSVGNETGNVAAKIGKRTEHVADTVKASANQAVATTRNATEPVAEKASNDAQQAMDAARNRLVQEQEAGNSTFLNVVRRVGAGDDREK